MPQTTLAYSLPITLECLNVQGQGVRVEFQKTGDRFAHTILALQNGKATPLLTSVEGTPDDVAPPSPPFSELHQQGEIVFLSGATTLGHWSMSVEVAEGRLLFDVACRLKKKPDGLGSTYRVAEGGYLLEPEESAKTTLQDGTQMVTPSMSSDQNFPATIQWRYTIAVSKTSK
jgi:hypothetical protein